MARSFWLIGAVIFSLPFCPLATAAQIGDGVPESELSGPVHPAHRNDDLITAEIRTLQQMLPSHGYATGPVTGLLDSATKRAILAYQRDAGLRTGARNPVFLKQTIDHLAYARPPLYAAGSSPPDQVAPPGAIGGPAQIEAPPPSLPEGPPATMSPPSAIYHPTPIAPPPRPFDGPPATMSPPSAINRPTPIAPPPTPGSNADQVSLVQQELKAKGYDIAVTGVLDRPTINAIKAFQGSNDMPRSGTVDDALMDKLKQ